MPDSSQNQHGIAIALAIAGSDSGGGAGIQADLKTFSALGVYGASAVTAVTAQNTLAVTDVVGIPVQTVHKQIRAVLDDLTVDAIKIGMLASPEIIETVADVLVDFNGPIVLDPVMVAKSGDALLQQNAIDALRDTLLPTATLITPNLPEAATLLGCEEAEDEATMLAQGKQSRQLGANAVLMKGGHARGEICTDFLITDSEPLQLTAPRVHTNNTHGTGCTLSAAIAALLSKQFSLPGAVQAAHSYLQGAINAADSLHIGGGHGPVHHFHQLWKENA